MPTQLTTFNTTLSILPEEQKVLGEIRLIDIKQSTIPQTTKDVILAGFSEKTISQLDPKDAGQKITTLMSVALFEVNYKADNIEELVKLTVRDIFLDFGHNTLSEISIAYRKGVRGEYGEFMGMSVRTFYNWIKCFNEETKPEAFRNLAMLKAKYDVPKEPTREEKIKLHKEWLDNFVDIFRKYKLGKITEPTDFGNVFYHYCIEHGIAFFTSKERIALYEKAKVAIKNKYNRANASSEIERQKFSELFKMIDHDNISNSLNNEIISHAKLLAIPIIFDRLIEKNLELEEMVKVVEREGVVE